VEGSIFVVEANGRLTSKVLEAGTGIQTDAEKLFCSIQHGTRACAEQDQIANNNNNETRGAFSLEQSETSLNLPAFDMELAHNLYQRIFEPVSQVLYSKKKLIIVSSDEALATLPFQLLLLSPHELSDGETSDIGSTYANAPWLIRQWAISVSTSVSAFTASRSQEQEVTETNRKPFLGIGDPVIGTQGEIDCSEFTSTKLAAVSRGLVDVSTQELFPNNEEDLRFADVNAVRRLARLPDTRCELESIATSLEGGDLLLDDEATEAQIKNLDELDKLADYDIISFATHGLVAGETNLAEPALVLTPPKTGSLQDDGLLTASEVAGLNLNAEWVLLSACNTASGTIDTGSGYQENESFAGLARAFFYAGAKSLLVSHWPVQSEAAVELTTETFQILSEQPDTDRASAFRLAMLAILDDPNATEFTTHPRYWAPFTLLGESR
ncbi:MAG: CHAT domain-containing protein, partial [Pseudomonadota bacterium]